MFQRCLPLLLSSLAAAMFFAPPAVAQSAGDAPGLFKDAAEGPSALNRVGQQRMNTLEQDSTTQSIRLVRLVDDLSQQRALTMQVNRGTRVLAPSVNPAFQRYSENSGSGGPMVELSIQRHGINAISEGTYAWMGSVQFTSARGEETVGNVTLVRGVEGEISGTIRIGGEFYLVRPLNGDLHALVNVDESEYPSGGNSSRHAGGSSREASQPASTSKTAVPTAPPSEGSSEAACSASAAPLLKKDPNSERVNASTEARAENAAIAPCSQIATDALVVYTSEAASDVNNIDNQINMAIQEANNSYDNSNAWKVYLSLAHSEQIGFNETGNIEGDLSTLIADGSVQSLRDQHDADVVVLLTGDVYNYSGLADEVRAEAEDAYAIVAAPYAAGGLYTLAHEVGHLQGGQHHPQDISCTPGTSCDEEGDLIPDAFGHRFEDDKWWCGWLCGPEYATMMAYTLGGDYTRVTHFSNPNVTLNDKATGTSSRYNVDALQTTASTVEDFRISNELRASMTVGFPGDSERTFTADPCGGTGSYSYEWRVSYNGPNNYGNVLSTQESFAHTFPNGTHYVKLTVLTDSQSDTAIQTTFVHDGDCSNPPCQITSPESTSDSLSAKTATTAEGPMTENPKRVALRGAAPNPFQSSTEIVYALPERTDVTLVVYDLMGRRVRQLAHGARGTGTHRVRLDGASLPSGVYVVRLRAGGQQKIRRITVVK